MLLLRCGKYYKKLTTIWVQSSGFLQQTPKKMFCNQRIAMTLVCLLFCQIFGSSVTLTMFMLSNATSLELHKSWADLHHHLSRQTIIMLLSITKGTYFGCALGSPHSNCCVSFEFLHSTISCGERVLGGQDETTSTQFIAQVYSFALLSLWVLALSMLHNLKKWSKFTSD